MIIARKAVSKQITALGRRMRVIGKCFSQMQRICFSKGGFDRDSRIFQGLPRANLYKFSSIKGKEGEIIKLQSMKEQIQKDINGSYSNYTKIRKSFIHHISIQSYSPTNQQELLIILSLISHYPSFPLPSTTLLAVYKIICFNMHWKSVEQMNQLLLFVLVADTQADQSPIFHQFIKYYLHLTIEECKFKYQIDFSKLSVYQAVRQFLGRLVQRGFMPRSPPYERNLNILNYQKTIILLVKNTQVNSTLMIKKINYTLFLQIKQYYQEEMRQNLYHPKKLNLFYIFNREYISALSTSIEMIHNQSIHLRQLYMKLYLTLPQGESAVGRYKYKNLIDLYWFSLAHIESIDHMRLDEVKEKIEVVIQFIKAVNSNMKDLLMLPQGQKQSLELQFDQILLIILSLIREGQSAQSCHSLFALILPKINAYNLWHFFQLLMRVIKFYCHSVEVGKVLSVYENYELVSLQQICSLLSLFKQQNPQQIYNYTITVSNALVKVLSTDYEVIGGSQIICLLKVYEAFLVLTPKQQQIQANAQRLRIFLMRYISDHHQQFPINQLQKIITILSRMKQQTLQGFDDNNKSYPLSLPQQLNPYLGKIKLLLSASVRQIVDKWNK